LFSHDYKIVIAQIAIKITPWESDPLVRYGKRLEGEFFCGMRELAKMTPPQTPPVIFGFGSPSLFGPASKLHAFRHCNFMRGFRLLEPQITSILQHFLDTKTAGQTGINRCRAFLSALFRASGTNREEIELFGLSGEGGQLEMLEVVSEENFTHAKSRRSIDLLIKWRVHGKPRLVAIENKLGHHITTGQLPSYKKKLLKDISNKEEWIALFVIAPEFSGPNAIAMRRNKKWRAVTWWGFMRHWEQALTEQNFLDKDMDFPRLRRSLWTLGAGIS
jgi:hypothetical protein